MVIVSALQFSSQVVALDLFFPRRPTHFLTLCEKMKIFSGAGDGNDMCSFYHCHVLFKDINESCVGSC